jgi:excisionase family DNA binding protein
MSKERYLRPEQAAKILNVNNRTLQLWNNSGKIKCTRTKGGHRRFLESEIIAQISNPQEREKRKICYCRVSTASQKEDMERQVEYLRNKFPNHEIIKDIGSGLNFKRKGFNSILDSSIKGDIEEVVVTHKDRLCRFSYDLIERIIREYSGGKIVVLNQKQTSPQEELINDLISIIAVFSSKLYGIRSHKKEIQRWACEDSKNEDLSNSGGKGKIESVDESI